MAAKRKKSRKRRKGRGKLVCPKTSRGKKVHASKGGCYIKTRVKKVSRKKRRKSRKGRRRKR